MKQHLKTNKPQIILRVTAILNGILTGSDPYQKYKTVNTKMRSREIKANE